VNAFSGKIFILASIAAFRAFSLVPLESVVNLTRDPLPRLHEDVGRGFFLGRGGEGEKRRWGDGEMGRWGDGGWGEAVRGRSGEGEMGRWGDE
jgi:hypothetical protein